VIGGNGFHLHDDVPESACVLTGSSDCVLSDVLWGFKRRSCYGSIVIHDAFDMPEYSYVI